MSTKAALKSVFDAGRPLVERWLDLSEEFAALRDAATEKGLDWSQIKSLLKAQVQDERDGKHRVGRIVERADFACAYAEMLGLGGGDTKMNEKSFSAEPAEPASPPTAPEPPAERPSPIKPRPSDEALNIPDFLDRRSEKSGRSVRALDSSDRPAVGSSGHEEHAGPS